MSDGLIGRAAVLSVGDTTVVSSATAIGNIQQITWDGQTRDSVEITTMSSPDKTKEFIPGLSDPGELSADINCDPTSGGTSNDLNTFFTNGTQYWFVALPRQDGATTQGAYWYAAGFLTKPDGLSVPDDDKITQSLTVKLTGSVTYADEA